MVFAQFDALVGFDIVRLKRYRSKDLVRLSKICFTVTDLFLHLISLNSGRLIGVPFQS